MMIAAKYKPALIYGIASGLVIILLKLVEHRLFSRNIALETYVGIIALIFTGIGVWVGTRILRKKTVHIVEPPSVSAAIDEQNLKKSGLTNREHEVLEHMARGLSNQEIAEALFISLSTVKTHTANLFSKLEVKGRMQAVKKARDLRLISIL